MELIKTVGKQHSGESTSPPVVPPVSSANNVTGGWTGGMINGAFVGSMYDFNVSVPFLDSPSDQPQLLQSTDYKDVNS